LEQTPVISIVDDDEGVAAALKSLVRSLGHEAVTYCSAEEFLGSGFVTATTCLISDVQMPGLSGVELQQRLTADGHHIPTIFVTAFPDEALEKRVLRHGATCYIQKLIKEDCLLKCIDSALKSHTGIRRSD
jgi:FixJ family two-component response regulator